MLSHGPGLGDVLAEAEALNAPLRVLHDAAPTPPVVSLDHPAVQLSAVKLADDGSGDLVVRMYEAIGDRAAVTVRTPARLTAASRCNLLEEPHASLDVTDGICVLTLRPFELVTLRLSTRE